MANVQIIKLSSGEDIIGDIEEIQVEGREFVLANKPCLIMMVPKQDNPNEFGIGLAPYAPFAKEHKVPIMPAHIVSIYQPETALLNEYNRRFGSGLIVPDNDIVTKQTLKG
jgi:hypothetical protein